MIQIIWDTHHIDVPGNQAQRFVDKCGLMKQDVLAPAIGDEQGKTTVTTSS